MAKNYEVEIQDVHHFKRPSITMPKHYTGTSENITLPPCSGMVISWSATVGWGELTIYHTEGGGIEIDSECMSKEFVKQVLEAYTRYILDKGEII